MSSTSKGIEKMQKNGTEYPTERRGNIRRKDMFTKGMKKPNFRGLGRMSDDEYKALCLKHAPDLIEPEHHELDHLGRLSDEEYAQHYQQEAENAIVTRKGGCGRRWK